MPHTSPSSLYPLRYDWKLAEIEALLNLPFNDLVFQAQSCHRAYFDPNQVQVSMLLSIKTGSCPEDCGYCPQSAHYQTDVEQEKLMPVPMVLAAARAAQRQGATRFCLGAAWRKPNDTNLKTVIEMVRGIHALGMESCVTLGMLTATQAQALKDAGLDYYNHNLDTSPEYYEKIITTRTYQDRLDTLEHIRHAGLKTCCGGILGMGESRRDRAAMLQQLANLPAHPESVPINLLIQIEGTPLFGVDALDPLEFVRMVATARILMPQSYVRLAAGREHMSDELQALCFFAGANSVFYGDKLLTSANAATSRDHQLFSRLGLQFQLTEPERTAPGACHKLNQQVA